MITKKAKMTDGRENRYLKIVELINKTLNNQEVYWKSGNTKEDRVNRAAVWIVAEYKLKCKMFPKAKEHFRKQALMEYGKVLKEYGFKHLLSEK